MLFDPGGFITPLIFDLGANLRDKFLFIPIAS
jgi:hypothetical protein